MRSVGSGRGRGWGSDGFEMFDMVMWCWVCGMLCSMMVWYGVREGGGRDVYEPV